MIDVEGHTLYKLYLEKAKLFLQKNILKYQFNYCYQAVKRRHISEISHGNMV